MSDPDSLSPADVSRREFLKVTGALPPRASWAPRATRPQTLESRCHNGQYRPGIQTARNADIG